MTRERLRAAVIGYGLAGRVFHAPLIDADDAYELAVIVTSNAERGAQARARYPRARIVPDIAALLPEDIDVAVVATPTPSHVEVAGRMVDAGIATVVDKPFAVRVRDGEALIRRAEQGDVPLTVFQNRRWDGDFRTVQRLVSSGALGDIWRLESRFEWISSRPRPVWKSDTPGPAGGGVAYDLGSHLIDQAIQLFGPVAEFWGELEARRGGPNDDDTFIALRHSSGVRSHLAMSSLVAQRGFRFRVLGSKGAYIKWGLDPQEAQLADGMNLSDPAFGSEAEELWGRVGSEPDTVPVRTERGGYREFYRQLAVALRNGGPVPVAPRSALESIRIIETLQQGTRPS